MPRSRKESGTPAGYADRVVRRYLYGADRPSLLNIPIVAVGFGCAAEQFSRCGSYTTTDGMLCRCGGR
jgi:hypothetical protein